jgi:UDP-N-acetylglucosamine 1-carboxyvinyltransferase
MGADIQVNGKTAIVTGTECLYGATVTARDLRAGAALIIAGLAAEGTTWVKNVHYVERGYEQLIKKMTDLGAQIRRVED